ncbi:MULTISPECIES: quinolinate synthase NadA [Caproicibacterium]
MNEKQLRILKLKKEMDAVVLAHYYVTGDVQEVADYVGDSFYLSRVASRVQAKTIVMCGVRFMAESAKILSPEKNVLLPAADADCPMAHMVTAGQVRRVRAQHEDLAVVCYVNSTAELKGESDVCVTSANAVQIVRALPNRQIYFIPDENLGRFIAAQVPEKQFLFHQGFCPTHAFLSAEDVKAARRAHPDALLLVHPECRPEVVELANYAGSTAGILRFARESRAKTFLIGTEHGVLYDLAKENPDKCFYPLHPKQICPNMKRITLEKVIRAMESGFPSVFLEEEEIQRARRPLQRMLELSKAADSCGKEGN